MIKRNLQTMCFELWVDYLYKLLSGALRIVLLYNDNGYWV